MSSHWFVFTTRTQRVFQILLVSFSETDNSFPEHFFFRTLLKHVKKCSYLYVCSFVKSDKYSWSEISLFLSTIIFIFQSTFLSLDFDVCMMRLDLSLKFVLRFLSLLDILHKKALSTIAFFNKMTLMIRKWLICI